MLFSTWNLMRTFIYLHIGKYTVINMVNMNTALLTSFCVSILTCRWQQEFRFAGMLFYIF
jgi:hypothetical protein